MRIECTTTADAEQVLMILMRAQWRPRQDFAVHSGTDLTPPIIFTLRMISLDTLLPQIYALPSIVIEREAGA